MVRLEKIELPEKHIFNGNDFPIAFEVIHDVDEDGKSYNVDATVNFLEVTSRKGFFKDLLKKHGAVVLRNARKLDAETLSKYITAIGINSGDQPFEQNGSTAKRTEITEVLSTANEGPPNVRIHQHNEFSRFVKYPTKLFFVCAAYNGEGGETPIVHGGEFFQKINEKAPNFIEELSRRGLYMEQVWPLKSNNNTHWSYKFCFGRRIDPNDTDFERQKEQAKKLAKEIASPDCEFTPENDLLIRQFTEPIRIYRNGDGEEFPCFFNSLTTFYAYTKHRVGDYSKTHSICYNDGGEIPVTYLDLVLETSLEIAYNHQWNEGDIVIVDNYMVSHGRLPWKGERRILVSMWDEVDKPEYIPWLA